MPEAIGGQSTGDGKLGHSSVPVAREGEAELVYVQDVYPCSALVNVQVDGKSLI